MVEEVVVVIMVVVVVVIVVSVVVVVVVVGVVVVEVKLFLLGVRCSSILRLFNFSMRSCNHHHPNI